MTTNEQRSVLGGRGRTTGEAYAVDETAVATPVDIRNGQARIRSTAVRRVVE